MDGVRLLPPLEQRPAILQQRLTEGLPVLHFAFGSNLSLARLTSRVPGGLTPLSVERAVVRNHRLAFNLRGLPPWEPSMASIEPCSSARSVTRAGQKLQHSVHGLLVALTHEDYDALYISEGGATGWWSSYSEYEVTASTYEGKKYRVSNTTPLLLRLVQAVAFRTRVDSRARLAEAEEQLPSRRYLSLIIGGAEERGLDAAYVESLRKRLARLREPWDLLG